MNKPKSTRAYCLYWKPGSNFLLSGFYCTKQEAEFQKSSYKDCLGISEVEILPVEEAEAMRKVVEAAKTLVKQIEVIHSDLIYQGVWVLSQMHVGPYKGPQYTEQLNTLKTQIEDLK